MNAFLNSLTEPEFTEFIQQREMPLDKLLETGRALETAKFDTFKEEAIDLRE